MQMSRTHIQCIPPELVRMSCIVYHSPDGCVYAPALPTSICLFFLVSSFGWLSEYDRHGRGIEAWRVPAPISRIKHALAHGNSGFIQLAESRIFVDKTYAITEFLQGGVQPVHLVLRGRRSGETTLSRLFQ